MDSITGIPVVHTPVLIIGSSMVGMTLSALLAKQGLNGCITVEKHASTAIHPRAALFHPRTMEIYQEMGLYDEMKAESAKYYDENAGIVDVESLAGRFNRTWLANMNEGIEKLAPVSRLFLTQHMFEPILRRKALENGADLRFSTEMISFQQDEGGVTALIRSTTTGAKTLVRADYMVACDGNRSSVRQQLGIKVRGHGLLSHSLTIYFKADVSRFIQGKYNGVIYINNPAVRGFIRIDKTGKQGFLVVNTAGERGTEASRFPADNITDTRAQELLRAAFGADVPFEIELIAPWRAVCDCAEAFSHGRVLLAGDAAHTVTPQGGFGGNTGIQDAHNLAWKLVAVLEGHAGRALVEQTYDSERQPVGLKTVRQVFTRYVRRTAPEMLEGGVALDVEDEVPDAHLELGYRYRSRAVVADELGQLIEDPAASTATPGSRAPHVIVSTAEQKDVPISALFDGSFVLLAGEKAQIWEAAARQLDDAQLPPVKAFRISSRTFELRYGVSGSGAVLVRPDGFVAWKSWREPVPGSRPGQTVREVLHRILCLSGEGRAIGPSRFPAKSKGDAENSSLSSALFARSRALEIEKDRLRQRMAAIDAELVEIRRMDALQSEMAMLAVKLMPVAERPPEYSFSECLEKRGSLGG